MIPEVDREEMVTQQLLGRGIRDPRVIDAMRAVPRECFVPEESHGLAHEDQPLPIGRGQTISQPYIVALMTELLDLPEHATVLEIGAGSGYQTAILAHIAARVCAIERDPELAGAAQERLTGLGFGHIELITGDGFDGWPGEESFDAILIACAPLEIPVRPLEQLRSGGRMVVPVGPPGGIQQLTVVTRNRDGSHRARVHSEVRFVPMT